MTMTDPIADMLSRIRNALQARHATVDIPASRLKLEIAGNLKGEGYIEDFKAIEQGPQGVIRIALKYGPGGEGAISGLERVSRPGRRVYCGKGEIPTVLGGLGINILSTPKGLLTGAGCQQHGVGGEILCNIW